MSQGGIQNVGSLIQFDFASNPFFSKQISSSKTSYSTRKTAQNRSKHEKPLDEEVGREDTSATLLNRNVLNQSISLSSLTKKKKRSSPSRRRKARGGNKGDKKKGNTNCGTKHDMPMGKKDLYFALDCEMVGVGLYGAESALARVSIVNWDCEVVLDTFVKVPVPVTDYRTFVSGVRSEDIESVKAMELAEVRFTVQNILRGKILIGHALENDLKALNITHPWCDTRDTAAYDPFMREIVDNQNRRVKSPRRLRDLAREELGKEIQVLGDAHSSIEDAIAALELYKGARPHWEAHMCEQLNKANEMENSLRNKTTGFMKRRVQPMVIYNQSMRPKSFHPRIVPLSLPSTYVKNVQHVPYIPTQGHDFYLQQKPFIVQHVMPRMNERRPYSNPYISSN